MKTFPCLLIILLLGAAGPAFACRGPDLWETTFLKELPEKAFSRDLVARVRIISKEDDDKQPRYLKNFRVRVVEGIKGVEKGDILTVPIENSSCTHNYDAAVSDEYFIAGSLNENDLFEGLWKGNDYFPWPDF